MSKEYKIDLPWPPSINHYYARRKGGGTRLDDKARDYRINVKVRVLTAKRIATMTGRIGVIIECYPPDKRKRDIDNLPKGVLDGLTHAGIWEDDAQVDELILRRMRIEKGGRITVTIQEQS